MGKKTKRKIRWRRLSLEDESSLTDSSLSGPEGEAAGSHTSEESSSSSSGVFTSNGSASAGNGKQFGQGQRGPRSSSSGNPRNRRSGGPSAGKPGNNSHHHHHYHHHHFGMSAGANGQHLYPPPPAAGGLFQPPTSPNFYCMSPNNANANVARGGNSQGNGSRRQAWQNKRNGHTGSQQHQYSQDYNNAGNHHHHHLPHQHHANNTNSNNHRSSHHHQYPGSDKRFLFIAETCYFNNKEYTKIQTPHQDLLFKKGWLSSRKKDLDGLNIPDRTAEAQKLAQEYLAEHPEKVHQAMPRTEEIPQSPTSDQDQATDESSGTGTSSSPEPNKDYQNGLMQDSSLCGDYYPAPAYLIPCEVMDTMGQAYPAMMVQQPLYGAIPWAIVPMPVPVYCYDKQFSSDYNTLTDGMSCLEITEELHPPMSAGDSPAMESLVAEGVTTMAAPENDGVEKIKMENVAEVLKDLSKDGEKPRGNRDEAKSKDLEDKPKFVERCIDVTPKKAGSVSKIKPKNKRKVH